MIEEENVLLTTGSSEDEHMNVEVQVIPRLSSRDLSMAICQQQRQLEEANFLLSDTNGNTEDGTSHSNVEVQVIPYSSSAALSMALWQQQQQIAEQNINKHKLHHHQNRDRHQLQSKSSSVIAVLADESTTTTSKSDADSAVLPISDECSGCSSSRTSNASRTSDVSRNSDRRTWSSYIPDNESRHIMITTRDNSIDRDDDDLTLPWMVNVTVS